MNYATFWQRFAAMWIDFFVMLPIIAILSWLEAESKFAAFVFVIPTFIAYDCYTIYCHGRFGQTIGKRVMGICVTLKTGEAIGWHAAWLRSSVDVIFSVLGIISSFVALTIISNAEFYGVSWYQQLKNLHALEPTWLSWTEDATLIWGLSEVFVMLFNKRRQALHDFIADTVVIKKHQLSTQISGENNILQPQNDDNNLVIVIPRWLVLSAFVGMIVFLSLNKSHDEKIGLPIITKPIEIKKPAESTLTKVYRPPVINVNTATLEELQALPRISEKIAFAIRDGRPYSSVDDLIRVYGIGPKTLENIRPFVKIE
jgi:DNA uptake protein ComE-like DNA-binding protein/uncharacterized RDD family membrane protein YckC